MLTPVILADSTHREQACIPGLYQQVLKLAYRSDLSTLRGLVNPLLEAEGVAAGLSSRGWLARPPSGTGPVFWLVASDSQLYLSQHRPDVSLSRALLQALASSGILLPNSIRLAPTP
jgi:hypothetical protein